MLYTILITILLPLLGYYIHNYLYHRIHEIPNELPYIHSFIPIFHSAIGFGLHPVKYLRKLRSLYGQYFSFHLKSFRYCLVPEKVYFKRILPNKNFSMDQFIDESTVLGFGLDRDCAFIEEISKQQVKDFHTHLAGEELQLLTYKTAARIVQFMKYDKQNMKDIGYKTVNLFDFCEKIMFNVSLGALYGDEFLQQQNKIEPPIYQLYKEFDDNFSFFMAGIPFAKILFASKFKRRDQFFERFANPNPAKGESEIIRARRELYLKFPQFAKKNYLNLGILCSTMLW